MSGLSKIEQGAIDNMHAIINDLRKKIKEQVVEAYDKAVQRIIEQYRKLERIVKWYDKGRCYYCGGTLRRITSEIENEGFRATLTCRSCERQINYDDINHTFLFHIINIIKEQKVNHI